MFESGLPTKTPTVMDRPRQLRRNAWYAEEMHRPCGSGERPHTRAGKPRSFARSASLLVSPSPFPSTTSTVLSADVPIAWRKPCI